jgi:ribosome recycling factor
MDEKLVEAQKSIDGFDHESNAQVSKFRDKIKEINPTKTDPSLISNILVDIHGRRARLLEVASISPLEGRSLEIRVFDKSSKNIIRDAITHHSTHFSNISVSGDTLILKLEPVTADYLLEIYRSLKTEAEHVRIVIKDIRRKTHRKIETTFGENKQLIQKHEKKLQDLLNKRNDEINACLEGFKKFHLPQSVWNKA